jgi:hypothetical protein
MTSKKLEALLRSVPRATVAEAPDPAPAVQAVESASRVVRATPAIDPPPPAPSYCSTAIISIDLCVMYGNTRQASARPYMRSEPACSGGSPATIPAAASRMAAGVRRGRRLMFCFRGLDSRSACPACRFSTILAAIAFLCRD